MLLFLIILTQHFSHFIYCPAIMLMICYFFYSYDTISDDTELKQRLEGITHLVEHPSQMQPPGNVKLSCTASFLNTKFRLKYALAGKPINFNLIAVI